MHWREQCFVSFISEGELIDPELTNSRCRSVLVLNADINKFFDSVTCWCVRQNHLKTDIRPRSLYRIVAHCRQHTSGLQKKIFSWLFLCPNLHVQISMCMYNEANVYHWWVQLLLHMITHGAIETNVFPSPLEETVDIKKTLGHKVMLTIQLMIHHSGTFSNISRLYSLSAVCLHFISFSVRISSVWRSWGSNLATSHFSGKFQWL